MVSSRTQNCFMNYLCFLWRSKIISHEINTIWYYYDRYQPTYNVRRSMNHFWLSFIIVIIIIIIRLLKSEVFSDKSASSGDSLETVRSISSRYLIIYRFKEFIRGLMLDMYFYIKIYLCFQTIFFFLVFWFLYKEKPREKLIFFFFGL